MWNMFFIACRSQCFLDKGTTFVRQSESSLLCTEYLSSFKTDGLASSSSGNNLEVQQQNVICRLQKTFKVRVWPRYPTYWQNKASSHIYHRVIKWALANFRITSACDCQSQRLNFSLSLMVILNLIMTVATHIKDRIHHFLPLQTPLTLMTALKLHLG